MTKKTIAVFGATGAQGGSVVDIFLTDPKLTNEWNVRAITRDPTKEAAKKLASRGAEVVSADLNDKDSLKKAMTGADAVFAVTNYWEKLSAEHEIEQGKALVDVAKEVGVGHFIWSSLLDINKLSNGKLPNVYHFDSKAKVEEYAREQGIPATFYLAGYYMTNLPGQSFGPKGPNNAWTLAMPVTESAIVPLMDTRSDTGKFVKAIVLHREKVLGKRVLGSSGYMTPRELLDVFKKVYPEAGKTATFYSVPHDVFKEGMTSNGMPEFVAVEIIENHRLLDEFGYFGGESLDWSHSLLEDKLTTWEDFLRTAPAFKDLK